LGTPQDDSHLILPTKHVNQKKPLPTGKSSQRKHGFSINKSTDQRVVHPQTQAIAMEHLAQQDEQIRH
jgi:hypothetical protein